jgi:hypothetical protein
MRFERGTHYPHPPRGPARKPYAMSDAALRQRCRNLRRTRIRSNRESLIIKLLTWQAFFGEEPKLSQRALARELRVWPSYVCKVQKQATTVGWDVRIQHGTRVTLDDLAEAQHFTARFREQEPDLLASEPPRRLYAGEPSVMTADECIAERRRFAEEWKRKNPGYGGRRVLFSVPAR